MKNTTYEWDVETYEGEDVTDHCFSKNIRDFGITYLRTLTHPVERLVLVRTSHGSTYSREWAYVDRANGKWTLPEFFTDADGHRGHKVPNRYHDEIRPMDTDND